MRVWRNVFMLMRFGPYVFRPNVMLGYFRMMSNANVIMLSTVLYQWLLVTLFTTCYLCFVMVLTVAQLALSCVHNLP